jgi:hypothetical protein
MQVCPHLVFENLEAFRIAQLMNKHSRNVLLTDNSISLAAKRAISIPPIAGVFLRNQVDGGEYFAETCPRLALKLAPFSARPPSLNLFLLKVSQFTSFLALFIPQNRLLEGTGIADSRCRKASVL